MKNNQRQVFNSLQKWRRRRRRRNKHVEIQAIKTTGQFGELVQEHRLKQSAHIKVSSSIKIWYSQ